MRRIGFRGMAAALMAALPLCFGPLADLAWAGFGAELAELEWHVGNHPDDSSARRLLAQAYEERGLHEEAVEQYVAILARDRTDTAAREQAITLIGRRMPRWLPEEAGEAAPFHSETLALALAEPGGDQANYRLLATGEGFQARDGERWDAVHERSLPLIDYAYVWDARRKQWVMRVRAHWSDDRGLAQQALRATAVFYCVAKEYLGCDPTEPWGEPVDVWLGNRGRPGARAVGRNLYLYSVKTTRSPGEWVRQVAHEYGHIALPGIGGFAETDDPWADGHLGELLFPKWLAGSGVPEWMPWSVEEWEREAKTRREALMAGAEGQVDEARLNGTGEGARDYFLGLVLRVEKWPGARLLGEALRRCRRGEAADFVGAAESLGAAPWRPEADRGTLEGPKDARDD